MNYKTIVLELEGPDFGLLSADDLDTAFEIYRSTGEAISYGADPCEAAVEAFKAWREEGFGFFDPDGVEDILTCQAE